MPSQKWLSALTILNDSKEVSTAPTFPLKEMVSAVPTTLILLRKVGAGVGIQKSLIVIAFILEFAKMFLEAIMAYKDVMSKIRYLDHLAAKWLMRHFYFMFFQMVLFVIFLFWFVNMFNVIDTSYQISKSSALERAVMTQSINVTITVLLLLLNSFWMLYIFNGIQRLANLLKDINYNINRLRVRNR